MFLIFSEKSVDENFSIQRFPLFEFKRWAISNKCLSLFLRGFTLSLFSFYWKICSAKSLWFTNFISNCRKCWFLSSVIFIFFLLHRCFRLVIKSLICMIKIIIIVNIKPYLISIIYFPELDYNLSFEVIHIQLKKRLDFQSK